MQTIEFKSYNSLLDYLIKTEQIAFHRRNDKSIKFGDKEFNINEFLDHLRYFDLISEIYTFIHETNFQEISSEMSFYDRKFILNELRLEKIAFNKSNFDLLAKNELFNNDLYQFRFLSINEACTLLGVTRPTIYRLMDEKNLPYYLVLDQRKVRYLDLMAWIDRFKYIKK